MRGADVSALTTFMERLLGITADKWNEKLGSDASDTIALERKLGTPSTQWLGDFGGLAVDAIFTADSTVLSADSAIVAADAAV